MTDTRVSSALTADPYADFIFKSSDVTEVWSKSRSKEAILDHLAVYFKPKSSFDLERVDYNALNILAEYQVFNLEFCKNVLGLNDLQSACVLHAMWVLLEFDPDQNSTSQKSIDGKLIVGGSDSTSKAPSPTEAAEKATE
jgi:hypothetical protein